MSRGFTLVELMVTLAIVAILMGIAAPSFVSTIEDGRATSQANDFLAALTAARGEAIKRGQTVTLRPRTGASFAGGWCVHVGTACNSTAPNEILLEHEAPSGVAIAETATVVSFSSLGRLTTPVAGATIDFSPTSCTSGSLRKRSVTVTPTGRAAIAVIGC